MNFYRNRSINDAASTAAAIAGKKATGTYRGNIVTYEPKYYSTGVTNEFKR